MGSQSQLPPLPSSQTELADPKGREGSLDQAFAMATVDNMCGTALDREGESPPKEAPETVPAEPKIVPEAKTAEKPKEEAAKDTKEAKKPEVKTQPQDAPKLDLKETIAVERAKIAKKTTVQMRTSPLSRPKQKPQEGKKQRKSVVSVPEGKLVPPAKAPTKRLTGPMPAPAAEMPAIKEESGAKAETQNIAKTVDADAAAHGDKK